MKMKNTFVLVLVIILSFTFVACDTNTPPPEESQPSPILTLELTPEQTPSPEPEILIVNSNGEDTDDNRNTIDFSKFPRPGGEWALFINNAETDIKIIIDETGERAWRYIPLEETGSFFDIEVKYRNFAGDLIVDLFYNGEGIGYLVDGLPGGRIEIDGIVYVPYEFLIQFFSTHHHKSIYHRTDIDRKILFLEESEMPWTLYIDDSPTDFDVFITFDYSDIDILNFVEDVKQRLLGDLFLSFYDVFVFIGAEFVHDPFTGFPNNHKVLYNEIPLWSFRDPNNLSPEDILTNVGIFAGIGFPYNIDLGFNNLYLYTP